MIKEEIRDLSKIKIKNEDKTEYELKEYFLSFLSKLNKEEKDYIVLITNWRAFDVNKSLSLKFTVEKLIIDLNNPTLYTFKFNRRLHPIMNKIFIDTPYYPFFITFKKGKLNTIYQGFVDKK